MTVRKQVNGSHTPSDLT